MSLKKLIEIKVVVVVGLVLAPFTANAGVLSFTEEGIAYSCSYGDISKNNGQASVSLSCSYNVPIVVDPVADPVVDSSVSEEREENIVELFHNDYHPYNSKEDLNPIRMENGKKLYIVNPGYSETSVPSCVNGKSMASNCAPTGWSMGMEKDEIFAVRYMTKADDVTALIRANRNQQGGLFGVQEVNYMIHLSDKPGDMTGGPFKGRCSVTTNASRGSLYITPPEKKPYSDKSYYCQIEKDTAFYMNVELHPDFYDTCAYKYPVDKNNNYCSGAISQRDLARGENVRDGATF